MTFGIIAFKKSSILDHLHSNILLLQIFDRGFDILLRSACDRHSSADRGVLNDLNICKDDIQIHAESSGSFGDQCLRRILLNVIQPQDLFTRL